MWPYCAYMCIMAWQTMLQEEVFLFIAPKRHFPFSEDKNGRFCEATTKWLIQNATVTFLKNTRPPYMDNIPTGGSKTFPSTSGEKEKFLLNRQEVGQIWTTGTWYDAHDFLQKSFLGSKYAILSKIQCKLSEAWPRAKNLHARCLTKFDDSLKQG